MSVSKKLVVDETDEAHIAAAVHDIAELSTTEETTGVAAWPLMDKFIVLARHLREDFPKPTTPRLAQTPDATHLIDLADRLENHAENLAKTAMNSRDTRIIKLLEKSAAALRQAALAPGNGACKTCDGRGEVGGFVSADSGYQTDPCPKCGGTGNGALEAEIAKIDELIGIEEGETASQRVARLVDSYVDLQKQFAKAAPSPAALDPVTVEAILNHHFYTGEPGQHGAIKAATAALLAPSRVTSTNGGKS